MKNFHLNLNKRQKINISLILLIILVLLIIYFLIVINFNSQTYSGELRAGFFGKDSSASLASNSVKEITSFGNNSGNLKILIVGDIQAGDFMAEIVNGGGNPFEFVKDIFSKYDLVIGSSEGVIAENEYGTPQDKAYVYKAGPRMADLYKENGIDIVTLATNHGMDYGADALIREVQILDEKGIINFGAGKNADEAFYPRMVIKNGVKIGFVAINDIENHITDVGENSPGLAFHPSWRTEQSIRKAKELCDIVIVMPHWGYEHELEHAAYQEQWAKQFIDWGADLVVGNHPHVRQDHEVYNGKHIFYALSNFAYTGMAWDPQSIIGSMLHVKIENKQISDIKVSTVNLKAWEGSPVPAGDEPLDF